MEIVIKIDDNTYEEVKNSNSIPDISGTTIVNSIEAIKNGKPLPKGHGRLIDADKFARFLKDVSKWQHYNKLCLDSSLTVADVFDAICADLNGEGVRKFEACPTIIEADKEETDGDSD